MFTKCCTTMTLGGLGDVIEQNLSNYRHGTRNPWNPVRTAKLAAFGLCVAGPMNHYWYKILDKGISGRTMTNNFQKLAADQILFAPIIVSAFFTSMTVMNGGGPEEIKNTLSKNFIPTMKMNYYLWPAAQMVNFTFVPPQQRVGYVACILLLWNTYLSYIGNHG